MLNVQIYGKASWKTHWFSKPNSSSLHQYAEWYRLLYGLRIGC